jgi:1-phosphofructokinase family hexose kinase
MIVTVTLNPAFDHLLFFSEISMGKLNRAVSTLRMPGGKGINVASSLAVLGDEVVATGFLGGQGSRLFETSLRKIGVTTSFTYIDKEIRTDFYIIEDKKNIQSLFIEKSSSIELRYLNNFKENFKRLLPSAKLVEIGGSLPKGITPSFINELTLFAKKKKVKVVLNLQESILKECLNSAPLFILYPDLRETCRIFGEDVCNPESRPKTAQWLISKGAEIVILKYGNLGYFVAKRNEAWQGEIEIEGSNVIMLGVRDGMLAGFIHNYLKTNDIGKALKFGLGVALSTAQNKMNYLHSKNRAEKLCLMAKVRKIA